MKKCLDKVFGYIVGVIWIAYLYSRDYWSGKIPDHFK